MHLKWGLFVGRGPAINQRINTDKLTLFTVRDVHSSNARRFMLLPVEMWTMISV